MSKLYQKFRITAQANLPIFDDGLKSTESEPKTLKAIHVQLEKYAGTDDNEFVGILETTTIIDMPEKLLPTELAAAVAQTADGGKLKRIEVDMVIPPGEIFKAGMKCAATAVNARGVYEYEITQT